MKWFTHLSILILLFLAWQAQAADTLTVTVPQADRLFLQNNLLVLAGQYNIQIGEAQAIQARLYPNPVFSADLNAYDPQNRKALHMGPTGEKAFAVEQLILLGGKRKSQIELARQNTRLAGFELEDLLRNLKFQLRSSLYTIAQQQTMLRRYRNQLNLLDTIIGNYELQSRKGNIPVKEVVRLKAAFLQLNNTRSEVARAHIEEMAKLRLLLRTEAYVIPVVQEDGLSAIAVDMPVTPWLDSAVANRPDLKAADLQTSIAGLNLKYQRQLVVPDVAVNSSYDQRGGAFLNQINAGISLPLPLWNRNRGGIGAAKVQTQAAQTLRDQKTTEVRLETRAAYDDLVRSVREYRKTNQLYTTDFEVVLRGVSENFRKRNISLIEFVDFIESYNGSIAEVLRVRTQLAIAAERINYVTTSKIYQ
jgi:cobalt-zinc-cadmium efflux system outer membrane protein